jgi:hypothetical protein
LTCCSTFLRAAMASSRAADTWGVAQHTAQPAHKHAECSFCTGTWNRVSKAPAGATWSAAAPECVLFATAVVSRCTAAEACLIAVCIIPSFLPCQR